MWERLHVAAGLRAGPLLLLVWSGGVQVPAWRPAYEGRQVGQDSGGEQSMKDYHATLADELDRAQALNGLEGRMTLQEQTNRSTLPSPLYGCAVEGCAGEVSYPADALRWWSGVCSDKEEGRKWRESEAGWYCSECIPYDAHVAGLGPSLAEELERRRAIAPIELSRMQLMDLIEKAQDARWITSSWIEWSSEAEDQGEGHARDRQAHTAPTS